MFVQPVYCKRPPPVPRVLLRKGIRPALSPVVHHTRFVCYEVTPTKFPGIILAPFFRFPYSFFQKIWAVVYNIHVLLASVAASNKTVAVPSSLTYTDVSSWIVAQIFSRKGSQERSLPDSKNRHVETGETGCNSTLNPKLPGQTNCAL